jgi:hypothetical protein
MVKKIITSKKGYNKMEGVKQTNDKDNSTSSGQIAENKENVEDGSEKLFFEQEKQRILAFIKNSPQYPQMVKELREFAKGSS